MHNFQKDLSNKVKEDIPKNTPQIPLSLKEIVNVNGNNNVIKNKKKFLNKNKSTLNNNILEIKEIENNTINNLNTYINRVNTSNNNFCNINNNSSNNNSNFDIPKKNNYTNSILSNAHIENTTSNSITSSPSVTSKRKYYEIKDKNSNNNSPIQTPVKIKLTHNGKILSQDKNSNYNSIIKDFNSPPITPIHSNIKILWDDFNAEPSSSSSSNNNNNNNNNICGSRSKGKHHSLTDEELYIINTADDDNIPQEFYTETSAKLSSEDSNVIDLENYSTPKNEDNKSDDDDVILISNIIDDKNSSSNSNNTSTTINSNINNNNNNNNNNNPESDHQDDTLTEDELLAIRLQFEEQEEFNNRMASISQYNLNDNFYDLDGLQIHSLYSSLDNFSSPMFMNSRGYIMDLRNYIEDDELDDSYEGLLRLEERIGNVKHSLDNNLINKNKVIKYSKDNKEIQETKCSICLLNYEEDEELRKLICSHFFHKRCIDNWFKNSSTCPICRMDVKEKLKS
ncbi:hypothetical protein LY90DRAFT_505165 [Neocallimastix californiae]|uniref:RING-type domain-containing protein n=1 Tax=Neocallimastix californiae TaxID=1754190 RepID=A0A1Y2DWY1_9FUNG|nr:hypothetical protein LY90DRAFT_505165 [Neocallimastix californiae]|eukprot:ORY63719.1 hypothetical protein LY90DRAFT_505165 [Neocallimastix californiae]